MEGCYNGFIGSRSSPVYQTFASDLCGYMYLFNNNQTLLSQFATLGYTLGTSTVNSFTSDGSDTLFKDLGLHQDYGNPYYRGTTNNPPYVGKTLYTNADCAYEHFLVSARLPFTPALLL